MDDGVPSASIENTLTSSLAAMVTSRCRPSPVSSTEPCDVRCGIASPLPPVGKSPIRSSAPSIPRRNAMTLFSDSLVCT